MSRAEININRRMLSIKVRGYTNRGSPKSCDVRDDVSLKGVDTEITADESRISNIPYNQS